MTNDGPVSSFVLGTVQLGMPYGTTLPRMPPSAEASVRLVRRSIACGVTCIDTARVYGESEQRIGRAIADGWSARTEVVTKLDPLAAVPDDAPSWAIEAACSASVLASCHALHLTRLPVLLLHRAGHRTAWDGAAWRTLRKMRDDGLIGRLGVSASRPSEVIDALTDPDVRHLQISYNLLDTRWTEQGAVEALARRPDVVVHTRSVFLQGVLLSSEPAAWPMIPGLDVAQITTWMSGLTRSLQRTSLADLCLAAVRAQSWIDGVVVGIESLAQLEDSLALFMRPPLSPDEVAQLIETRPSVPGPLLDPALWPARG